MHRRYPTLLLCSFLVVVACEKTAASIRPLARSGVGPGEPAVPDTIAAAVRGVATEVDTTVTLGVWMKSHPQDRITEIAPTSGVDDPFCRAAVAPTSFVGHTATRSAGFYIPEPPAGELLPEDTAEAANRLCELRTIWVTMGPMDSAHAKVLADSLRAHVDENLRPQAALLAATRDKAGRVRPEYRRIPRTTVMVRQEAVEPGRVTRAIGETPDADTTKRDRVWQTMVIAYAPGSGVQEFDDWEARYDARAKDRAEDARLRYRDVDSALALANVPAVATDLQTVLSYLRQVNEDTPDSVRPARPDDALLRAVKATHDMAPSLPAPRRAALLLATDIVLFAVLPTLGDNAKDPVRIKLQAAGITFDNLPIDQEVQNTRPWLWEAYRLDSLGRIGELAFTELLSQGWTTRGACADTVTEYKAIIEHGEAALKAGRTDPRIHFYLGSAYKTIVDLSNWDAPDYNNPAEYKTQAETARVKGIEHFRIALRSLADPAMRKLAWTKAMRLMLRRSGEQPEYYCFYD